jgi:esterase
VGSDDEFALLPQNAADAGLQLDRLPPGRRVSTVLDDGQQVSALLWGDDSPQLVLLHGGGQNAHTWDTVVLAAGLPALAIDLPGHGHSDWRADHDYSPASNAEAVVAVLRQWAPEAKAVIGMSMGGLTTIRLTALAPQFVRRAVIVDVTPSVMRRHHTMTTAERGTTALVSGPESFATLEEIVELTAAAAPHRARSSIRRGVVHNTKQRPDGRWQWRYDVPSAQSDYAGLWDDVSAATMPLTLVRGGASAFVSDLDAEEFVRRHPGAQVEVVAGSGHSVQSDAPLDLTAIILAALAVPD